MRRAAWWSLLGLLGILVLLDVLGIFAAVTETATGDEGLTAGLGAIVLLVLVGVAVVAAARTVEHYRRRPQRRQETSGTLRTGPSRPDRRIESAVAVVALVGAFVVTPFWVSESWTSWQTSVETQDHGLPSTLTVHRVVRVFHHTGRGGGYYSVHLQGELDPPVDGRTHVTAYIPRDSKYAVDEQVPVLVDPHNLDHAERQGLEDYSVAGLVGLVCFAVICDLSLVLVASQLLRRRRSRAVSGLGSRPRQ